MSIPRNLSILADNASSAGVLSIAGGGTNTTSFAANQIHYGSFSQSAGLTFDGTNFATTGTATAAKLIPTGTSVTGNGMYLPATNALGFSTNGTNAVYIDASQNVGVGGTPVYKLDVFGTVNSNASLNVNNTGTTANILFASSGQTGTTVRSNVVGRLQSTATGRDVCLQFSDNVTNSAEIGMVGGPMYFATGGLERMRIDSSGNVGVGQTVYSATTVGIGFNPAGLINIAQASSTSAGTGLQIYSTTASAFRFYVDMGGTIHATSVVITAISDERLKENVRDIDTGLNAILSLKPRRFDWKEGKGQDKKNAAGFIAQEFEEVFPECVGVSKAGGDGIEYKNINHETLIPTLVKAIQEQQALITTLTARIEALETK